MNFAEIMEMLRNPQALQARAEELKRKTESVVAVGSAGGGLVKVTLNGAMELLACEIAPEAIDPSDPVLLQDLVRAAHNDAAYRVREALQKELAAGMADLAGGMPLPPGLFGNNP